MSEFIGPDLPPDVLYESDEDKDEVTEGSASSSGSTTKKRKYEAEANIGAAVPTKKQHIEENETTEAKIDTIDDDDFYGPPLPPPVNIKKDEPVEPIKINEVKKSEKKILGPSLPPPQLLEQVQNNTLKEVIGPMPAGVLNPNMYYHVVDDEDKSNQEDQKKKARRMDDSIT